METLLNGLTPKELMFLYEYLKDFRKRDAAIRAGLAESYAHVWASAVCKKPAFKEALQAAMDLRVEQAQADAQWVLDRMINLYNADLSDIINYNNRGEPYFDFSLATPDLLECIESINIAEGKYGTNIKVNLPSKVKLLEMIGKHISVNAFKEAIELSGNVNVVFDDQDQEA